MYRPETLEIVGTSNEWMGKLVPLVQANLTKGNGEAVNEN